MSGPGLERKDIIPLKIAQPGKPFSPFTLSELQQVLADKGSWPLARKPFPPNPELESGDSRRIEAERHRLFNQPGSPDPLKPENVGLWQKLLASWQVGKYRMQFGLVYETPDSLSENEVYSPDAQLRLFPITISPENELAEERTLFLTMQIFSNEKSVAFDLTIQPEPEGQVFRGRIQTDELGDMVDVDLSDGGDNIINHILLVPADAKRLADMKVTIFPPEEVAKQEVDTMN